MDNVSIDNGQWTIDNCRAAWGMCLQGDNCQLSIESPVLTSHFPDSAFSGNAHFRNFVPIRKSCVKYFKIRLSERIRINLYSHNYTVSNAKKASFAPIFTDESTGDWLRTDERLPSYGRVRTLVVVRPYENSHRFSLFSDRRGTILDVLNCIRPCEKTDGRKRRKGKLRQKERELTETLSMCKTRIAREGPSRSPTRISVQGKPFSGDSFDILTN